MTPINKTLALALVGSTLLWTACGKDEQKSKSKVDKGGTPKIETLSDKIAPAQGLDGFWLTNVSEVKGMQKTEVWHFAMADETSASVTSFMICKKDGKTDTINLKLDIAVNSQELVIKNKTSQTVTSKVFDTEKVKNTDCTLQEQGNVKYGLKISANIIERTLRSSVQMYKMEEKGEQLHTIAKNDKVVSIDSKDLKAKITATGNRPTTPGAPAPGPAIDGKNDVEVQGRWFFGATDAGVSMVSYLSITEDSISMSKTCLKGEGAAMQTLRIELEAQKITEKNKILIAKDLKKNESFKDGGDCNLNFDADTTLTLSAAADGSLIVKNTNTRKQKEFTNKFSRETSDE